MQKLLTQLLERLKEQPVSRFINQFRAKGPLRSMFRLFTLAIILMFTGVVLNATGWLESQMELSWLAEIVTYLRFSVGVMTNPTLAHKDTDDKSGLLDPMGVRE